MIYYLFNQIVRSDALYAHASSASASASALVVVVGQPVIQAGTRPMRASES